MLGIDRCATRLALSTIVPQLGEPIGVDAPADYMREMGVGKLARRALQRSLIYAMSGQDEKKINSINGCKKRGLWLYFGEGQLGDALMDLAPRSLLHQNGYRMDLLTDNNLAETFQHDPWFETVSGDADLLASAPYDFAIVLSNKRRSIQCKRRYFKNLPWVSIHENFSGPNFDRAGFATQRLADLLGLHLSRAEFAHHANQKLRTQMSDSDNVAVNKKISNAITLCLGGVDPLRTYEAWAQVISGLLDFGIKEYVLVGSSNGTAIAKEIKRIFQSTAIIHDFVGKCSIGQTHDLVAATRMVITTDGGLLHLAATTRTPVLALFTSNIRPEWRLKAQPKSTFIWSPSLNVNTLRPGQIAAKARDFYMS